MRGFIVGLLIGIVLTIGLGVFALAAVGHALAVEDPLEKADVIVAISGDTGARTNTAISLWKQGFAPLIVFSGSAIDPDSVSSAEIMRREALRQGVPENATIIEPASATTEENATEVAKLMVDAQASLRDPRDQPVPPAARGHAVQTRLRTRRHRAAELSGARSRVGSQPLVGARPAPFAHVDRAREARR